MVEVFVSYASQDRHVVKRLVEELTRSGKSVWWDRAIRPGDRFDRAIDEQLASARAVVVVWSKHSVESDWVRWEASEALNRDCLIPIRIDTATLPFEFQLTHTLDLRNYALRGRDPGDELEGLIQSINNVVATDNSMVAKVPNPLSGPLLFTGDLQEEPRIAVLPFKNQSSDEGFGYFADGLSDDLVQALALWKSFPVISYASTLDFKDKNSPLDFIAEQLGVRYLVTGNVRRTADRIRVTAELTDVRTMRQIWQQRWTVALKDFFELQEEICAKIVTNIQPQLLATARDAAMRKKPANMNAWDLSLRAHVESRKHQKDSNLKARDLASRALQLDPTSVFAQVTVAQTYYQEIFYKWTHDVASAIEKYARASERAMMLDPNDANANVQQGTVSMLRQDQANAARYLERAIEINPYSSLALTMLGQLQILYGDPKPGVELLEKAIQLMPQDHNRWGAYGALALGHYASEQYSASITWAEHCVSLRPQFPFGWALAAACSVATDQLIKAKRYIDRMYDLNPTVTKHELLFVMQGGPKDLKDRFIEQLAIAGYSSD